MSDVTKSKLDKGSKLHRRQVLAAAAGGALALSAPWVWPRTARAATRIFARYPGGPFEKAFNEAFFHPFNEMMKGEVEVVGVTSNAVPTSEIKTMVDTKNYAWNIAELEESSANVLVDQNYLEKVEVDNDADVQEIPAQFRNPYLTGIYVSTVLLAYRTDAYPKNGPEPKAWKDLWNSNGRISLRKHVYDTSEQAVLADGVAPKDVYPIDFDRVFKSLDKVRPKIKVWWETSSQSQQLMSSGEVDCCPMWNGRAQGIIDAGAPVKKVWNQSFWQYDGWAILKGTPHLDLCRKFIAFASNAKRQAAITKYLAYGPVNANALKYVDQKRLPDLPTFQDNLAQSFKSDAKFWGGVKDQAFERFNKWFLKT